MRIAVVSDAWRPQRNGVVRVLDSLIQAAAPLGGDIQVIGPDRFRNIPCPSYPEIRLALFPATPLAAELDKMRPEAIHIAAEGPLGWAARAWCLKRGLPFTTAYHTKFPEYVHARTKAPLAWSYALMRRFHAPSTAVMCPSPSVHRELLSRGFANAALWSHGVDCDKFHPQSKDFLDLPRPLFMYVGRVAVEKNLPAFLSLDLPGSKMVVGDGPARSNLMKRFPQVHWRIANGDMELSRYFAAGDCFVFPSKTDTFGLVMLEALASGVPVAAFPVAGPQDVLGASKAGVLDEDLHAAALSALTIAPQDCRDYAASLSWRKTAEEFLSMLQPFSLNTEKAA